MGSGPLGRRIVSNRASVSGTYSIDNQDGYRFKCYKVPCAGTPHQLICGWNSITRAQRLPIALTALSGAFVRC